MGIFSKFEGKRFPVCCCDREDTIVRTTNQNRLVNFVRLSLSIPVDDENISRNVAVRSMFQRQGERRQPGNGVEWLSNVKLKERFILSSDIGVSAD